MIYWAIMAATAGAMLGGGAAVQKLMGLLVCSVLVRLYGPALLGPLLALAVLLPEAGGARPAALPLITLLLWPLAVQTLLARDRSMLGYPPVRGLLALCAAGALAAVLGLLARRADPSTVLFEAFQPHVHMLAFVVFAWPTGRLRQPAPSSAPAHMPLPWIAGGAVVVGGLGIAQLLGGEPVIAALAGPSGAIGYPERDVVTVSQQIWWGVRKAYGTFFSPNGLGAAAAFTLVSAVAHLAGTRPVRPWIWRVTAVVSGAVLVGTFSRAALVAGVCGLLLLAVAVRRRATRRVVTAVVAFACALPVLQARLLVSAPDVVSTSDAPNVATTIKAQTASMKIDEISRAISMFSAGHWLGSGYGVIYEPGLGFVPDARSIGVSPVAAEIVYRSGVPGLVALAMALVAFASLLVRAGRLDALLAGRPHTAVLPLTLALCTALVLSLIDHPFYTVPGLSVLFWAAWGLLARHDPLRPQAGR
ncbi:MAG: O-antigen ligase family protein [Vicinamibacterales bacterium]